MSMLIQKAEYGLRAAKHLGVKDRAAFTTLMPNIQPVVIVADARDADNPLVDRRAIGFELISSAVAQFAAIELFNPLNSGLLLIVDEAHVVMPTAGRVQYRVTGAGPLTNAPTKASQYRDIITGQPIGQVRADSLVAFTVGAGQFLCGSTNTGIIQLNWRIAPGNSLRFIQETANLSLGVTFLYREVLPGDPAQ